MLTTDIKGLAKSIIEDPVRYAEELFYKPKGQSLWRHPDYPNKPDQRTIIEAPFRHRRCAIGTGHKVGKTDSAACQIALWLWSHVPSYVIITSASWPNVEKKIFPALKNKLRLADPDGSQWPIPLTTSWRIAPEYEAIGISPEKEEVAQGWHSDAGTLVIIDEGSSIDRKMFESLLSVADTMVVYGNPIRAEGPFADILTNAPEYSDWVYYNINAEETPNYRATKAAIANGEMTDAEACASGDHRRDKPKEIVLISGLAKYSECRSWERKYGRASSTYSGRVLGFPPDQSEETLIARSTVMSACAREIGDKTDEAQLRLNIDVAWSAIGDETVFGLCSNKALYELEAYRGWDEERINHRVRRFIRDNPNLIEVRIDRIGVGNQVYGNLHLGKRRGDLELQDLEIIGVVGGATPSDPVEYFNLRGESWGLMNEALKNDFAIPSQFKDSMMEMCSLRYFPDRTKGRIQIEAKADYKSRVGHSPDHSDMLAMNFSQVQGQDAFRGSIRREHLMKAAPNLYKQKLQWMLHMEGCPATWDRPGVLCRAVWYSRRDASAMLIVHVDGDGCWSAVEAKRWSGIPLTKIAEQICQTCRNYEFDTDLMSGREDTDRAGEVRLIDVLYEELERRNIQQFPDWMDSGRIRGVAGLDIIDRMLLGTLARFPSSEFWQNRQDFPADYQDSEMLVVWPRDVWQELRRTRLKERTGRAVYDEQEMVSEDLVGQGPPYVKCLRLMAVAGVSSRATGAT